MALAQAHQLFLYDDPHSEYCAKARTACLRKIMSFCQSDTLIGLNSLSSHARVLSGRGWPAHKAQPLNSRMLRSMACLTAGFPCTAGEGGAAS